MLKGFLSDKINVYLLNHCVYVYLRVVCSVCVWSHIEHFKTLLSFIFIATLIYKITTDDLLQRYYDLLTWAGMKAKPKKSQAYR